MNMLGYVLVAFVCSTPANMPDGEHKCQVATYGYHATSGVCASAAKTLIADLEGAGARVPKTVCRTVTKNDPEYDRAGTF